MAAAATDIKIHLAANMPEDDTSAVGGAVDASGRVLDDQFTAAAQPEVVSDNAGDVQNCTITGRLASGVIASEVKALTGTTPVLFSNSFERIISVTLASAAVGTITVKQGSGGTTRHTFAAGEDLARALFTNSSAEVFGGGDAVRYEKVFVMNDHATDAALAVTVAVVTDPRGDYDIILEDAINDTNSASNRVTLPTGNTGSYGDGPHAVPGSDLAAGDVIGVWVRQTLAAGTSPSVDAVGLEVAFSGA